MASEVMQWVLDAKAGNPPRWLTLLGRSGIGKTHLATVAYKAARAGYGAQYGQCWPWRIILNMLREGKWSLKDHLFWIPVLVVDDLCAGHDTAFSQSFADELADARLGKWTIWTSNLTWQEIDDNVSSRVASRMRRGNNRVLEIVSTPDYCDR